ncbi:restriction endonuclease subunit S domain-containing protein [Burkholderia paludis]|uniref:hypothetical protein n=1 Tax=Burkholderia paludis TaxID=1506587 RepID=UPI001269F224|nr:hypothetical protein [Burkholderia paludis]
MKLWTSGEIELDVEESSRIAINEIEPVVNRALEGVEFDEKAEKWTLIPIILSDAFLSSFPEIAKRSSKGTVLEFRIQIPHDEFKQSSPDGKMAMLFDALNRSIDLMPKLKVSLESQKKFYAVLEQARASLLPG